MAGILHILQLEPVLKATQQHALAAQAFTTALGKLTHNILRKLGFASFEYWSIAGRLLWVAGLSAALAQTAQLQKTSWQFNVSAALCRAASAAWVATQCFILKSCLIPSSCCRFRSRSTCNSLSLLASPRRLPRTPASQPARLQAADFWNAITASS